MHLSSPIYVLKRRAKELSRAAGLKHHEALQQVARQEGFRDWSHLVVSATKHTPAQKLFGALSPGDLVLIGARRGQGKTLLAVELVDLAARNGWAGYFFTLDYTQVELEARYCHLGLDTARLGRDVIVDTSDGICAAHVARSLAAEDRPAFVVVDYLQLLDEKRSTPPLGEQVAALGTLAQKNGAIILCLSQIDRSFDLSGRTMPELADIRLPNPVDLSHFTKRCFLHQGDMRLET